jgi:hypothetical protein
MVKSETILQVQHILKLLRDVDFDNEFCNKQLNDIRCDLDKLLSYWMTDLRNYDESNN